MGDHGEVAQMGTSGRTGLGSGSAPGGFSVDGAFARSRKDATATGEPEAAAEADTRSDAAHSEKPSPITDQASSDSNPGRMATAGRIAADATANLAQGALSVAKEAAVNWMDAAKGRIAEAATEARRRAARSPPRFEVIRRKLWAKTPRLQGQPPETRIRTVGAALWPAFSERRTSWIPMAALQEASPSSATTVWGVAPTRLPWQPRWLHFVIRKTHSLLDRASSA